MALAIGAKLAEYEIVAPIGAGGMGEVYKAHDTKLGRDVAIKVLPDGFADDAERLVRFEREAKLLASLNHDNIATRAWDRDHPGNLRDFITRVNRIRRDNPALHSDWSLQFHAVDNERLIAYSKKTEDLANAILVVVNLDPHHPQSGWLEVPLAELGLSETEPYQVHNLLGGSRFLWSGARNYVSLNPQESPAYLFRLRRKLKTECDFDYFF